MADLFVGPVMEKLIDACFKYLEDYSKDQVRWQTGMKKELEKLQKIHPDIQDVVSAYSKAHIKDPDGRLNRWLWNLRDAIDEAEDVLDTFEYRKHEKEVRKNRKLRKMRSIMKSMKKRVKRAIKIDPDLKKLEKAVQKLEKVSAEVIDFHHLLKSTEKEQQKWDLEFEAIRETGSLPTDVLLGRSDDMKSVVQWLTTPSNEHEPQIPGTIRYRNISLLSVVGHGGMGKTSLLQQVCKGMTQKEFDVKIWVCVSNDFNAIKVIKGMLESIKIERPCADGLDALQKSLESEVKSKKFLLVLDDIWEDDDETEWRKVLAPLADGCFGSKILVTTRMESAASTIAKVIGKDNKILRLKGLEEDECLQLLITHAFAGVKNPDDHQKLKYIAEEMVKKLSGSPLAAKVIGGALNSKLDDRYWRNVLNSDIGNVEPGQNQLLPILKLSYIYLPKELQNCFAFCSIFPQDYVFCKDDLVRMWIALGFIQSPNIQGETVEDIGGRYFDILVRKSFFEEFHIGPEVYYNMHDVLHELAQFVSKQECFKVADDKKLLIPETIRHLSIWSSNTYSLEVLQNLEKFKHLRSLFLSLADDICQEQNLMDALSKVFNAARSIRLFFISFSYKRGGKMEKLPETIRYLSHLRYLEVSDVIPLPRSINHLNQLQFIIYDFCFCNFDEFVPENFNNQYNLRYLRLPCFVTSKLQEIGKLKFLQSLKFLVGDEIGCRIGELEHMNELRQLTIYQLQNIKDAEEACSAKLCDKSNLTDLSLQWGFQYRVHGVVPELDEMVLENIQPPNSLKKLIINEYMGVGSARWMNNIDLTSNLEHIELHSCFKWETLPPFGQLPFLKYLYLNKMSEVKRLDNNKDCVFPSLQELHIVDLPALQEWFDATVAEENDRLFRCLSKLYVRGCPKLQQLPSLPPKLQELELIGVEWKGCNWLKGIISSCCEIKILSNLGYLRGRQELKANENCQLILDELVINDPSMLLMEPLRSITSLEELKIVGKDETVSFPQVSSSLRVLKFESLKSLQTLPSSLESLSSLEILSVLDVPQPQLLPNLPHSLIELKLKDLESLQCLPSSLSTNSYLTHLQLTNIPLLKSLPHLPSSLELLELKKLESLQYLPSSLSTISSLECLYLESIPLLKSLPDLPSSLERLNLKELQSLQCLPSSLSAISSLEHLHVKSIPLPKSLPDLPSSLERLKLNELESLQCLPSSLEAFSSLKRLHLKSIPLLKSLPDLPSSLELLKLKELESLQCLPSSLVAFSSLERLHLKSIPLLKSLPDLPSCLLYLYLEELQNLDCLPSCLPDLYCLIELVINKVPQLLELPDLPTASLRHLSIENCHPELKDRHEYFG